MRSNQPALALAISAIFSASLVSASEPNEDSASATILSSGVLSVSDQLDQAPDTLLGIQDFFGSIGQTDDDGSPAGNTRASGLEGISTQDGSVRFAVTGLGDDGFVGNHNESGAYEVFVQTYDSFGSPSKLLSPIDHPFLQPGVVDEYSFFDEEAFLGSYDVWIDNLGDYNVFADIDFFTFTGLTPGANFTAKTLDPLSSGLNTLLALYDADGFISRSDDDSGGNGLSLLNGIVPADGRVTLAVTGSGDDAFLGDHPLRGAYDLTLTLGGGGFAADFTNDGRVDAADLTTWKGAFGQTSLGDADDDQDSDGADCLLWQRQFGSGVPSAIAIAAVPEPATGSLIAVAVLVLAMCSGRCFPSPTTSGKN